MIMIPFVFTHIVPINLSFCFVCFIQFSVAGRSVSLSPVEILKKKKII